MFKRTITSFFGVARQALKVTTGGARILQNGVAGALQGDMELQADRVLGLAALKFFMADPRFAYIVVEGMMPHQCVATGSPSGTYVVGVDPLDASLSYKMASGSNGAPYTVVVTIAKYVKGKDISFGEIVASGVMSFACGDEWYAEKGAGSYVHKKRSFPFVPSIPLDATQIDLGQHMIDFGSYYAETRHVIDQAFPIENGYLVSHTSAAWVMAMVASGGFAAQISLSQKHHELGAAYLLVTLAGGVVINARTGISLANSPWMKWTGQFGNQYNWDTKTPMIAACNAEYAKAVYLRIKPYLA